jgi:hypothetical protein
MGHVFNPPPQWPTPPVGWAPPAGWVPDPAWGPPPPGWSLWVRANQNASRWAVGSAVISTVVVWLLAEMTGSSPYPPTEVFGEVLAGTSIVALIVGLRAHSSTGQWRPWWYVLAILCGSIAVWAATSVPAMLSSSSPEASRHLGSTPARWAGWDRLHDDTTKAYFAQMRESLSTQHGTNNIPRDAVVTDAYSSSTDQQARLVFVGFDLAGAEQVGRTLREDPHRALSEIFKSGQIGSVTQQDPGSLGGHLDCGTQSSPGQTTLACAWADRSTLGVVRVTGGTTIAHVADLTRNLRQRMEH